jgi:hypothetical protein
MTDFKINTVESYSITLTIQMSLQRWMRFLMWRGNLRRKGTVWASFTVAGCSAGW